MFSHQLTLSRQSQNPVCDARIVDLFAGPGGLDVAACQLGIPVHGIEWDKDACATRRAAGLPTTEGDVRAYGPADFPDANVLAGGPPCQTYTVAGTGVGRRALDNVIGFAKRMVAREDVSADLEGLGDERTGLVLEPLRWALAALDAERPYEAIVLEQVPAVLPVWEVMAELLEGEGYSVDSKILRAEEFGVPQTRRRAILIARHRSTVEFPDATHRPYRKGVPREVGDPCKNPWVPMGEVLDRPDPFVVISNYGTGGDPKVRGRRKSTEPAATVTGKISRNRVVRPDGAEEPRFSFSEAGRIQTFPAKYPWQGCAVSQQIGNAIPPRLALHVLCAALGVDEEERDSALKRLDSAVRGNEGADDTTAASSC